MKLVLLETPYAGNVARNVRFAKACMRDCLQRGEAPFASHLLYTQQGILKDSLVPERMLGIEAGLLWGARADYTVVYTDFGISFGMQQGIHRANKEGREVFYRTLNWSKKGQTHD